MVLGLPWYFRFCGVDIIYYLLWVLVCRLGFDWLVLGCGACCACWVDLVDLC